MSIEIYVPECFESESFGGSINLETISLPVKINDKYTNLVFIVGEDEPSLESLSPIEGSKIDYKDFPECISIRFQNEEQISILYCLGQGEESKIPEYNNLKRVSRI